MADIPEHIIFNSVLPRLPAKSLLRFKSVSKSWYTAITSPHLAQKHVQESHLSPFLVSNIFGFFVDAKNNLGIASIDDENVIFQSRDWFFDEGKQTSILMFGSCNGLIGFMRYNFVFDNDDIDAMDELNSHIPEEGIQFIVYNPTLGAKSFVVIDLSTEMILGDDSGVNRIEFGLLYVSSIDDYNVIALGLPISDLDARLVVCRYSLRYKQWECVLLNQFESVREFRDPWFASCNVLVEENLHWLATSSSGQIVIAYLDLNSNKFSNFHLPNNIDMSFDYGLCCLDGKLCVWGGRKCVLDHNGSYEIEMWNMGEYGACDSWKKVFVLSLNDVCYDFLGSANSTLIHMANGLLFADFSDDIPNFVHVHLVIRRIMSYFESLVSPLLPSNNQQHIEAITTIRPAGTKGNQDKEEERLTDDKAIC